MEYQLKCGCIIVKLPPSVDDLKGEKENDIKYCPLHKSAGDLYEALMYVRQQISLGHYTGNDYECVHCKIEQAIAKVERG